MSVFFEMLVDLWGIFERVLLEFLLIDVFVWFVMYCELYMSWWICCVWDLLVEELGRL